MKCSRCRNQLVPVERPRTMEFRGRSVTVPARYLQCEGCGELLVDPRDSTNASQRAADAIRREEGLLTSEEIRTVREERLGLTQREFERLLRVGKNTVVRWEAGTVIQSAGIDDKIRALVDVPEFADYLAERHNVSLSTRRFAVPFPGESERREFVASGRFSKGVQFSLQSPDPVRPRRGRLSKSTV